MTTIGPLSNPVAEEGFANIVGRFALGFAPVRHAMVDQMSQVSVGYPESPMNGPGEGLVSSDARPPHGADRRKPPFGSGAVPRFTLLASSSPAVADVLTAYPRLLNDALGAPPDANGRLAHPA